MGSDCPDHCLSFYLVQQFFLIQIYLQIMSENGMLLNFFQCVYYDALRTHRFQSYATCC